MGTILSSCSCSCSCSCSGSLWSWEIEKHFNLDLLSLPSGLRSSIWITSIHQSRKTRACSEKDVLFSLGYRCQQKNCISGISIRKNWSFSRIKVECYIFAQRFTKDCRLEWDPSFEDTNRIKKADVLEDRCSVQTLHEKLAHKNFLLLWHHADEIVRVRLAIAETHPSISATYDNNTWNS